MPSDNRVVSADGAYYKEPRKTRVRIKGGVDRVRKRPKPAPAPAAGVAGNVVRSADVYYANGGQRRRAGRPVERPALPAPKRRGRQGETSFVIDEDDKVRPTVQAALDAVFAGAGKVVVRAATEKIARRATVQFDLAAARETITEDQRRDIQVVVATTPPAGTPPAGLPLPAVPASSWPPGPLPEADVPDVPDAPDAEAVEAAATDLPEILLEAGEEAAQAVVAEGVPAAPAEAPKVPAKGRKKAARKAKDEDEDPDE